ncbi:MAG TPA: hypothetical protein VGD81_11265 [Opitutaceae bacterium]
MEAALKSHPEVATTPGLPAKLTTLSSKIEEIKSLVQTQTQPIQASTAKRDQRLEEMTGTTLEIAGFVTSLAREQNLPDLLRTVDVAPGFRRARRAYRLGLAQRVLEAAQGVLAQLATYGVTEETMTAFEARIQSADEGLAIPRSTVVAKKAATLKLASVFEEVDVLLEDHLDRLVFPLRNTHVEFYAVYRAARAIVDRRGGRRATGEAETPTPEATTSASAGATTMETAAA